MTETRQLFLLSLFVTLQATASIGYTIAIAIAIGITIAIAIAIAIGIATATAIGTATATAVRDYNKFCYISFSLIYYKGVLDVEIRCAIGVEVGVQLINLVLLIN